MYFNHKKVYRIMKKYNLLAIPRRHNPYKQIWKATQEHRTLKNILNREFRWWLPYTKLWTDISYLPYKWNNVYFSIVKDMISWEVLCNNVSDNLWLGIAMNSLNNLENYNISWALIHSDQWFHYTHPSFQLSAKKLWLIQSMSRKWNCIDNAPTESFFWHMKDEIDISNCNTIQEVEKYIQEYIVYYNTQRPQRNKKKMTPIEYRNHLLKIN